MSYIAYKTAFNDPDLPNGFITEHFETSEPTLEGYNVVSLEVFNGLFQNNISLMRTLEKSKGIVTITPNLPPLPLRQVSEVEHVPSNFSSEPSPSDNAALFQQFLAWVAAGKPSNT